MSKLSMPPRKPAPPAPKRTGVQFSAIEKSTNGRRIVIYGTGGIGKTSLACSAPGPVAFFDLDNSLSVLQPGGDIRTVSAASWDEMMLALKSPGWDDINTIVIDSGTIAEEMCLAWVIENVPHEKGHKVRRIEDYGFAKGYSHIYGVFYNLLNALEHHSRQGRNVVVICHECISLAPNPAGDDYKHYEPRMQNANNGNLRHRIKEWCDDLLFVNMERVVSEKKDVGSGVRVIYSSEQPFCMAKSRTLKSPMVYHHGSDELWKLLLEGNN